MLIELMIFIAIVFVILMIASAILIFTFWFMAKIQDNVNESINKDDNEKY